MLVLLVEDHDDSREAMAVYLAAHGIRVEAAVTGLQAITKAVEMNPDAIVMDLGLPAMDGWEAARRLKEAPETESIPIIALSAHALLADEERARRVGCDVYLRKPCAPNELLAAIRALRKASLFSCPRRSPPGRRRFAQAAIATHRPTAASAWYRSM
jgi:two-component system, cell cycle response regulator DivK